MSGPLPFLGRLDALDPSKCSHPHGVVHPFTALSRRGASSIQLHAVPSSWSNSTRGDIALSERR